MRVSGMLKLHLRSILPRAVFRRADDLYYGGSVETASLSIAPKKGDSLRMSAPVLGDSEKTYRTAIEADLRNGRFSEISCTCPYETNCKHGGALALECIACLEEAELSPDADTSVESIRDAVLRLHSSSRNTTIDTQPKIRDAEILPAKNTPQNTETTPPHPASDETALREKLASIGIRADALPADMLRSLSAYTRDSAQPQAPTSEREETDPGIAETHRVVLVKEYGSTHVRIRTNALSRMERLYGSYRTNSNKSPKALLRDRSLRPTKEQRDLLSFLANTVSDFFYITDFDWIRFFTLLQASKIPVFSTDKENDRAHELPLSFGSPAERPLRLFVGPHPFPFYDENEQTILFDAGEFSEKNAGEEENTFFFDKNKVVTIVHQTIVFHTLSETSVSLIRSARSQNTWYRKENDPLFLPLSEKDLIDIADISKEISPSASECVSPTLRKISSTPTPLFLVDYNAEQEELSVVPAIDYGSRIVDVRKIYRIGAGNQKDARLTRKLRHTNAPEERFVFSVRDDEISYAPVRKKTEKTFLRFLLLHPESGFSRRLSCTRKGDASVFAFFSDALPFLKKSNYPVRFVRDECNFSEAEFRAEVSADADVEGNWFSFDAQFFLGDEPVTLDELQTLTREKKEFLSVNGKKIRLRNRDELDRLLFILEHFDKSGNSFRGRLYHAGELGEIFTHSPHYTAQFSSGLKKFLSEAKKGKPVETVKKPVHLKKTLRTYQSEGVDWMHFLRKYRFAGILADDMGLGKTLQALSMIHLHRKKGSPSIVICPKTLISNWETEAEKFFPDLRVLAVEGSPAERKEKIARCKTFDLVITSYPLIQRDKEEYARHTIVFHYCILDESQNIKNHRTKNARFIKEIDADYRLAVTGTPLENSVSEIWSLFDFLMPGFLGTYAHFTRRFLSPIMKKNDAQALEDLRNKTRCFMLRRAKSDVLKELPPKIEQTVTCRLSKQQRVLYQEVLERVKKEVFENVEKKGFSKSRIHILAGLMKLRQVCNHPALLFKEAKHRRYDSGKLELFLELIDESMSENKKVLVFSQFTSMLDILSRELDKQSRSHLLLTGKTKDRKSVVRAFNEDDQKRIFLISTKAGGTGLNLTAAERVILFDPWWNPAVENQAIDRAHRIGQTRSVHVCRLVAQDTIEEKILALQKRKQFLFDNLVGESRDLFKKLTWKDIRDLFS